MDSNKKAYIAIALGVLVILGGYAYQSFGPGADSHGIYGNHKGYVDPGHDHFDDGYTLMEVSSGNAPKVTFEVFQVFGDTADIKITTDNFVFAPEHANGPHVDGEGHGHIYLDGRLVGLAYRDWYHVDNIPKGEHIITVDLATNNHMIYAVNGERISFDQKVIIE